MPAEEETMLDTDATTVTPSRSDAPLIADAGTMPRRAYK
jgi:hypothetical protein